MVYCDTCVYHSGGPGTDNKYEGDNCNHPSNVEYISNYYSAQTQRYLAYPASINEDNDCEHYNGQNRPAS